MRLGPTAPSGLRAPDTTGRLLLDVVGLEDQVPPVHAVGAPVGDDLTRLPPAVFGRVRDEVGPTAAVDAHDRLGRCCHRVRSWKRATPSAKPGAKMTSRPWRSSLAKPSASS